MIEAYIDTHQLLTDSFLQISLKIIYDTKHDEASNREIDAGVWKKTISKAMCLFYAQFHYTYGTSI